MHCKLECVEDKIAVQPESAGRRAAAYWFIDGLPEILFGIAYLIMGATGMAWGFYPKRPWMLGALGVSPLVFLLLLWKDRAILDFCKARLTYPRTGYAKPPGDPKPAPSYPWGTRRFGWRADSNVTAFRVRTAFVFIFAWQVASFPFIGERWGMPVLMALAAVAVFASSLRDAHPYSWQSALAIALAGLLSAIVEMPRDARHFVPLLIGGVWLLAQGVPALVRYLRTYPVPKGEGA